MPMICKFEGTLKVRLALKPTWAQRMWAKLDEEAGSWMFDAFIDDEGALVIDTRSIEQPTFEQAQEWAKDCLRWYLEGAFDITIVEDL